MSSKEQKMKKMLIQRTVGTSVLIILMLGCAFLISNYSDDLNSTKTTRENQNNTLNSEHQEIERSLGMSEHILADYNHYITTHNPEFEIKREALNEILPSLRKEHHFASNMETTISSITEITDPVFKIKTGTVLQSTVKIVFSALSDSSVYNFIYDLQHKLPGIVMVSGLRLTKNSEISQTAAATALTNHTIPSIVTGEISLVWLGIHRDNPAANKPAGSANEK